MWSQTQASVHVAVQQRPNYLDCCEGIDSCASEVATATFRGSRSFSRPHLLKAWKHFAQPCTKHFAVCRMILPRPAGVQTVSGTSAVKAGAKAHLCQRKRQTSIGSCSCSFTIGQRCVPVEVVPENETAVGKLDICFIGNVTGQGPVSFYVEVKLAHAQDLEHGLDVQLP